MDSSAIEHSGTLDSVTVRVCLHQIERAPAVQIASTQTGLHQSRSFVREPDNNYAKMMTAFFGTTKAFNATGVKSTGMVCSSLVQTAIPSSL